MHTPPLFSLTYVSLYHPPRSSHVKSPLDMYAVDGPP